MSQAVKLRKSTYWRGMVTEAGKLIGRERSSNPTDRHRTAWFRCSKCAKLGHCRMSHFLKRNHSCGCGAEENRRGILDRLIRGIPEHLRENIAMCIETGKLEIKGPRGDYSATRNEIANYFRIQMPGGWLRYVLSSIHKRWVEDECQRLGESRMVQIWRSVQKHNTWCAARRWCNGKTALVQVACRWVRKNLASVEV